jgi:hypothetical protein
MIKPKDKPKFLVKKCLFLYRNHALAISICQSLFTVSSAVLNTLFDGRVIAVLFAENKDPFLAIIFPVSIASRNDH